MLYNHKALFKHRAKTSVFRSINVCCCGLFRREESNYSSLPFCNSRPWTLSLSVALSRRANTAQIVKATPAQGYRKALFPHPREEGEAKYLPLLKEKQSKIVKSANLPYHLLPEHRCSTFASSGTLTVGTIQACTYSTPIYTQLHPSHLLILSCKSLHAKIFLIIIIF